MPTDECECGNCRHERTAAERPLAPAAGSAKWMTCSHHFEFFFGPIMKCVHCGATVAASVDGQPRDIWPPNAQVPPTAPATKEDTSHE